MYIIAYLVSYIDKQKIFFSLIVELCKVGLALSSIVETLDNILMVLRSFFKARAEIKEVHFLPFNPTDKRTALTYIDAAGKMHRVSKGAPEQVVHNPL